MPEIDFDAMEPIDLSGDCKCGRPRSPVHCVYCGSTNLRGTKRLSATIEMQGLKRRVPGFTCHKCGSGFNLLKECAAKPPKRTKAEQVIIETAEQIDEQGRVHEYIDKLREWKKRSADMMPSPFSHFTREQVYYRGQGWLLYTSWKSERSGWSFEELAEAMAAEIDREITIKDEQKAIKDAEQIASRHSSVHTPGGGGK